MCDRLTPTLDVCLELSLQALRAIQSISLESEGSSQETYARTTADSLSLVCSLHQSKALVSGVPYNRQNLLSDALTYCEGAVRIYETLSTQQATVGSGLHHEVLALWELSVKNFFDLILQLDHLSEEQKSSTRSIINSIRSTGLIQSPRRDAAAVTREQSSSPLLLGDIVREAERRVM
jgi:hypothetical protein